MAQAEINIPFGGEINLHPTPVHIDLCPPTTTVKPVDSSVNWFNRIRTRGDDATSVMES